MLSTTVFFIAPAWFCRSRIARMFGCCLTMYLSISFFSSSDFAMSESHLFNFAMLPFAASFSNCLWELSYSKHDSWHALYNTFTSSNAPSNSVSLASKSALQLISSRWHFFNSFSWSVTCSVKDLILFSMSVTLAFRAINF